MAFLMFDNGNKVELPNLPTCEERIAYCEQLLDEYPLYFEYTVPTGKVTGAYTASEKAVHRLSVMGEYIYNADEQEMRNDVTTSWKNRRNKQNEVMFSSLGGDKDA